MIMTAAEIAYLTSPHYYRTVLGWRINDFSLTLSVPENRKNIEGRDVFGFIPSWVCENCGPVEEPGTECTYRGCGHESFSGPEPAEYEYRCPSCDRLETVNEYDGNGGGFKVTNRFRTRRTR